MPLSWRGMAFSSKFFELFGLIDPYKEFVELQRSRALLAIRAAALIICSICFLVYVVFTCILYANTPQPSQLSIERIIPSDPPQALFQFSIALPLTLSTRDPLFPTSYISPFSSTLTKGKVDSYVSRSRTPELETPSNTFDYEIFTFPVYGTVDGTTSTSTLLYFEPCRFKNFLNFPVLFFVGPPSSLRVENLEAKQHSDRDFRVTESGSSTEFVLLFDNFNGYGPEISIELVLQKTVSSTSDVTYNASIFAPPSYSPPTRGGDFSQQRTIAITVKPTVNVVTYSPRNILALLGSLAGIFPVMVSVGGIVSSMIWSKVGPQKSERSKAEVAAADATELNVVSNSTELNVVSNSTELNVVSNSTELNVVSNSTELNVVSNSTELNVVSNSTELNAMPIHTTEVNEV
jgi:hypothetical protein